MIKKYRLGQKCSISDAVSIGILYDLKNTKAKDVIGRQKDAHEYMMWLLDKLQPVVNDGFFGGEWHEKNDVATMILKVLIRTRHFW